MNIEELRSKIDKIDTQLLKLLKERMGIVVDVGKIKNASKENVYRPEREKAIIDRLLEEAKGKLDVTSIRAIFQEIFAASRNLELP